MGRPMLVIMLPKPEAMVSHEVVNAKTTGNTHVGHWR